MAVRVMARTLRGLEEVAAHEIEQRRLGEVEHLRHREVWFAAAEPTPELLGLRTVDDLFLVVGIVDDVGHTKADLPAFAEPAAEAPLREALRSRHQCGGPETPHGVDVAASFLGRRTYSRYDIEDTVGERVAALLDLPYHSRRGNVAPPEGNASFRVTLEDRQAVLALRITQRPLHRRDYKQSSTVGTLHPPLAAAMALLADSEPGQWVLDPCCGTGTLLIEAGALAPGAQLLGGDHDGATLTAAVSNADLVGLADANPLTWTRADAGRLPLATGGVDRVVSNPPWGRQVTAHGTLAEQPHLFYSELRRVLAPQGRAVLLLHDAEEHLSHAKAAGLREHHTVPVSLFGTHPSVVTLTG
ncbi:TRM11 family SAM-dependent methyltransferase [Salinactinospora qingdaonensis]|uniref:Ribosomal RNA large subunit methyltransferase K/L-like methyltransferase domain-containing protein n=1 Tax=Salinactinospora qingdaonensis TaxID=702744 RepID=A0ABP7F7Q9_9ACTN